MPTPGHESPVTYQHPGEQMTHVELTALSTNARSLTPLALLTALLLPSCVTASAAGPADDEPLYEELFRAERERMTDEPPPSRYDRVTLRGNSGAGTPQNRDQTPYEYTDDYEPWAAMPDPTGADSQSVGRCNSGRLANGRVLPREGPGFLRKNDKAAFGTDETVALITWACAQMERLFPGTVPMVVGDLSAETGGRLRPHKSHQSGRDVDFGFYLVGNQKLTYFRDATPKNLDVEKTWTFIELLIITGQVEYIFIDRSLHAILYDEAVLRQWDPVELQSIFEAPLGAASKRGIIRHAKGHKHHMHVRFYCAEGDQECE